MIKIKYFIFLAASAATLLLIGCKPDPTEIYGRVVDKKTGEPIEGAIVTFCGNRDGGGVSCDYLGGTFTDAQGDFYYIEKDGEADLNIGDVSKDEYYDCYYCASVKLGTKNYPEIQLLPRDGILKLTVRHGLITSDTLYGYMVTDIFETIGGSAYYKFPDFPIIQPVGAEKIYYRFLPAEEDTRFSWGNKLFVYENEAPFRDTVQIIKNDTTYYTITY